MIYALYVLLALWLLDVFFLAVMSLFRARAAGTLSLPAKVLGYPILLVGVLLDLLVNVVVLTVVFVKLPEDWMVTKRLYRYSQYKDGWRKATALWICSKLLNPFDPDQRGHCR